MIGLCDRSFAEIDRRREWLVGLCQEIVRRPTENRPGTTTACADLVRPSSGPAASRSSASSRGRGW